jgi:hypothetical protein
LFYLDLGLTLAANHLITRERAKFDTENKSSFLLEIMTQVSSANNVGVVCTVRWYRIQERAGIFVTGNA